MADYVWPGSFGGAGSAREVTIEESFRPLQAGPNDHQTLTAEQINEIRASWICDEKNSPETSLHPSMTRSFWRGFVIGLSDLFSILPPPTRRQVYMPQTTMEEEVIGSWKMVGRALCTVTQAHDAPQQTRVAE